MNAIKILRLREWLTNIAEVQKAKIEDYPYDMTKIFIKQQLIELLKEHFGSSIEFSEKDTFNYFVGLYKGINIEININNGVIFSVGNKAFECIINDFEPVFNEIFGTPAICKYQTYSGASSYKSLSPVIEWNLNPEERIFDIACSNNGQPKGYIKRFRDLYTPSLIKELGDDLLTSKGAEKLFGSDLSDQTDYRRYIFEQIVAVRPDLNFTKIAEWLNKTNKIYVLIDPSRQ